MTIIKIILALAYSAICIYFGYQSGSHSAENKYLRQLVTLQGEYEAKLRVAEAESQDISKQYLEAKANIDELNKKNNQLADQLDDQYNDYQRLLKQYRNYTKVPANSDTRCVTRCAPCPKLSREVARYVNELTREADAAANYAQQCRKWALSLNAAVTPLQEPKTPTE